MKEKTYTVHVTGCRYGTYRITARGSVKAQEMAEQQFKDEYGDDYWDYISTQASADWQEKEAVNETP